MHPGARQNIYLSLTGHAQVATYDIGAPCVVAIGKRWQTKREDLKTKSEMQTKWGRNIDTIRDIEDRKGIKRATYHDAAVVQQ